MDFVQILCQVNTWKSSANTYKVKVTDPEEYLAYMVEICPTNPRHMVDTIGKFQPLLTLTDDPSFARVLLAFKLNDKYYVLYEYFEEIDQVQVTVENAKRFLKNAENALGKIHKKEIFHGDICKENVKWTESGVKIVGWRLPLQRSFDPEPEPDWTILDIKLLREVFAQVTNFCESLLVTIEKPEENPIKNISKIAGESDFTGKICFVSGKFLKVFSTFSEEISIVSQIKVPKGSSVIVFFSDIYVIGGDYAEFSFAKFEKSEEKLIGMADLLSSHKYHTSIEFNGDLWVLGGIGSVKCEFFNGRNWEIGPDLNEVHESPACCVHENLYIFGKSIEKFQDDVWIPLLYIELIGCLGIVTGENSILLFGGRNKTEYSSDILLARPVSQDIIKVNEGTTGMYGLFGHLIKENTLFAASNAGKIFKTPLIL